MEKKNKQNKLILLISLLGSFVILMLVGTFGIYKSTYTYKILKAYLVNFWNIWENSRLSVCGCGFSHSFQAVTKENKFYLALKILLGVLAVVGIYVFVDYIMEKFFNPDVDYQIVYKLFFTLVVSALTYFATFRIDKEFMKKLSWFAIGLLMVLAISQIIVSVSKGLWSRLRFRNLDMDTHEGYTPWYKFHFGTKGREQYVVSYSSQYPYHPVHDDSDAFRSMPSGHTAAAA